VRTPQTAAVAAAGAFAAGRLAAFGAA
jgi:hypothetical protein